MYKVKTLNEIDQLGLDYLPEDFKIVDDANADAILVRSADMLKMEFDPNLLAIGRAGVGVNNIPLDKCAEKGIVVFNTPGANANGVKELVLTGMLLSSRDIPASLDWVKTLNPDMNIEKEVESGKKQFVGPELHGKTLGVIGLGAVGVLIANAASALGMEVLGFDPYISVQSAWGLSRKVKRASSYEEVYVNSDYLTLHIPLLDSTRNLINAKVIKTFKKGMRLLNFARAELVDDDAIGEALESGQVYRYVTDFPNAKTYNMKNVIAIPHLGASTPESEINCAIMAVNEISAYLQYGTISNSVNFPNCICGPVNSDARVTILHQNIPNMVGQITTDLGTHAINIAGMQNMSRKDWAYTVLEIEGEVDENLIKTLESIKGVVKVRLIKA